MTTTILKQILFEVIGTLALLSFLTGVGIYTAICVGGIVRDLQYINRVLNKE